MLLKNIKSLINATFLLLISWQINAQNVGINSTGNTPDASALLDVGSGNPTTGGDTKGVLIPRVALTDVSVAAPVASPATSLIIFNTNAAATGSSGRGYYYWDGTQWAPIGPAGPTGASGSGGCVPTEITDELTNDVPGDGTTTGFGPGGTGSNYIGIIKCAADCAALNYNSSTDWVMPYAGDLLQLQSIAPSNTSTNNVWTASPAQTATLRYIQFDMSDGTWTENVSSGGGRCRCVR